MSRLLIALFALGTMFGAGLIAAPSADAANCVRFSATHFDASGNDNYNTNGEWVRIKNYCSSTKTLSRWVIHDYGRKHTYRFATGVKIKPGATITLKTGVGRNTASTRFWGRSYGAVWNNTGTEWAYLKNANGVLQHRRTE